MRSNLLLIVLIVCTLPVWAQLRSSGQLPIQSSSFTVEYTIEQKLVNGKRETTYRLVKKGTSSVPQLIKWEIPVLRNGQEQRLPMVMEIPVGSTSVSVVRKLNPGDQLLEEFVDKEIRPIPVLLPGVQDFKPKLDHRGSYILQGEEIRLYVEKSKEFAQIDWYWSTTDQGESIRVTAGKSQTYTVYGRYRGTSFRTPVQSITVEVKRSRDLVDFEIMGPLAPVDDTAAVRLMLQVKRNEFGQGIRWRWTDEKGELLRNDGLECVIKGDPFLQTGKVTVCPIADGRVFGCSNFQIPVNRLPGPAAFTVQYPSELYTDVSALVRVLPSVRHPQLKWTWVVNGNTMQTQADSIRVQPLLGMKIEVYPTLNKRGGVAMAKTIRFQKVVVRTTLPRSIKGKFKFCGVPTLTQEYRLEGAVLGSESKQWVLYENNKAVLRFSGNVFRLKPQQSASYVVAPDNRSDLRYPFRIDVIDLPKLNPKPMVVGPTEQCAGEPFTLQLRGLPADRTFDVVWSRMPDVGAKSLDSVSTGDRFRDVLTVSARYLAQVKYKGCSMPIVLWHKVSIPGVPLKPEAEFSYVNRSRDRIRLTATGGLSGNRYQWSSDNFKSVFSENKEVASYRLKRGTNTFAVRYVDRCGQQSGVGEISVTGPKRDYFFLNAGLNGLEGSSNRSFQLTLGNRFWYARGKASLPMVLPSLYPTELAGNTLEITNDSRVVNYPSSTGTYYEVNGQQQVARMAVTTGFLFGLPALRVYVGGGFGRADQLWGLDIKEYAGTAKVKNYWAMNRSLSAAGPEIEGGLFLKINRINLMAGGSMIYDQRLEKPFMEVTIGLGFSTR